MCQNILFLSAIEKDENSKGANKWTYDTSLLLTKRISRKVVTIGHLMNEIYHELEIKTRLTSCCSALTFLKFQLYFIEHHFQIGFDSMEKHVRDTLQWTLLYFRMIFFICKGENFFVWNIISKSTNLKKINRINRS